MRVSSPTTILVVFTLNVFSAIAKYFLENQTSYESEKHSHNGIDYSLSCSKTISCNYDNGISTVQTATHFKLLQQKSFVPPE